MSIYISCMYDYVSIHLMPLQYIYIYIYIRIYTETQKNGTNGKQKWQSSVWLLQTEKRHLFSLASKRQTVIDRVCCFSKRANLCKTFFYQIIFVIVKGRHLNTPQGRSGGLPRKVGSTRYHSLPPGCLTPPACPRLGRDIAGPRPPPSDSWRWPAPARDGCVLHTLSDGQSLCAEFSGRLHVTDWRM